MRKRWKGEELRRGRETVQKLGRKRQNKKETVSNIDEN